MSRQNAAPKLPTLPKGDQIASYTTYLDAQKAVEALSDKGFPVQQVTIVGTDLKMVERVTGRLNYPRVAVAGMASGAWFGLFVGLLLSMFGGQDAAYSIVAAIAIGAGFGLLFSVLSFSLTRGKRDFTSASQIVAASYAVLCERESAGQAVQILRDANLQGGGPGALATPVAPAARPAPRTSPDNPYAPVPPTAPAPEGQPVAAPVAQPAAPVTAPPASHTTPSGEPRYGVRVVDGKPQIPGAPQAPAAQPTDGAPSSSSAPEQ